MRTRIISRYYLNKRPVRRRACRQFEHDALNRQCIWRCPVCNSRTRKVAKDNYYEFYRDNRSTYVTGGIKATFGRRPRSTVTR